MRSTQIRSRLVEYVASAINPETGKRDIWRVKFIGNNKDDRVDWCNMARSSGFRDIRLEKYVAPTTPKTARAGNTGIAVNPDVARKGLEMLDALMAARTN